MKKITNVSELKQGDRLVSVQDGNVTHLTFLMIHPCNNNYSLCLDFNKDAPKFYNKTLVDDYFLFESDDDYAEIYRLLSEWHKHKAEYFEKKMLTY